MFSYELDNGEAMHSAAPASFYLPPLESRKNLKPGETVKLVFRIKHDSGFDVERMWVQIESVTPSGYIGVLDNDPYCTKEFQAGALVEFGPEHVIQIYET